MAFDNWKASFKSRSERLCREAFDEALREEFGRAMAREARASMARFEPLGLWVPGDSFAARRSEAGILELEAVSQRGDALGMAAAGGEAAEAAFRAWRQAPSGPALSKLWAQMEPAMAKAMARRAKELGEERALAAFEGLAKGAPWERELGKALAGASGAFEVEKYPRVLMRVFKQRLAELARDGLLPGVGESCLMWAQLAGEEPRSWESEYGGGRLAARPGGSRWERRIVGFLSSEGAEAGSGPRQLGERAELCYDPCWGPLGCFKMGGWVHSARVRWIGAQAAAEADWRRFEPSLAKAHAWLLAEAMGRGSPLAVGLFELSELGEAVREPAQSKGPARL